MEEFNYKELKDLKDRIKYRVLKEEMINCLYKDICFPIRYYQSLIDNNNEENQIQDFKVKSKRIKIKAGIYKTEILNNLKDKQQIKKVQDFLNKNIDLLYQFKDEKNLNIEINNLINIYSSKEYFTLRTPDYKYYLLDDLPISFFTFNRDIMYKVLYYLNNKQENKAIELLNAQIKTNLIILDGDYGINNNIFTLLEMNLDNLDIILNNFDLSRESKKQLKYTLGKNINFLDLYENISKYIYIDLYENINKYIYINMLRGLNGKIFFDIEYTRMGLREIYFNYIKNIGELPEDIILKYKDINYFKKNQLGQIIWSTIVNTSFSKDFKVIYNKLEDIFTQKENLLKKLDN